MWGILKYKEWGIFAPSEARWVYDLIKEEPEWSEKIKDYIFKKRPKRIDPRDAKKIIKEHDLKCVCKNEYGMIYK